MVDSSKDRPVRYDPGPSGTAVAGLIIGMIALAVALYSALAPRDPSTMDVQMVRQIAKSELDARFEKLSPSIKETARSVAREEISRTYLVPSPEPDPGMAPGSNVIKLEDRPRWKYQRIE